MSFTEPWSNQAKLIDKLRMAVGKLLTHCRDKGCNSADQYADIIKRLDNLDRKLFMGNGPNQPSLNQQVQFNSRDIRYIKGKIKTSANQQWDLRSGIVIAAISAVIGAVSALLLGFIKAAIL